MKQALLTLGLAALLTAVTASAQAAEPVQRLPDGGLATAVEAQRRLDIRTQLTQAGEAAASLTLPGRVVMNPTLEAGWPWRPPAGRAAGPAAARAACARARCWPMWPTAPTPSRPPTSRPSSPSCAASASSPLSAWHGWRAWKAPCRAKRLMQRVPSSPASRRARPWPPAWVRVRALRAPLSGLVASSNAVAGQVVEPRELVFEIVDPARVLIETSTADATLAAQLQPAAPPSLGVPRRSCSSWQRARCRDGLLTLHFRAGPREGARPTAPVAIRPAGAGHRRPAAIAQGVVLSAALTRSSANEPQVWLLLAAERFVPQPVQAQPLDASTVLVTQGLAADQRVVVQGAALLSQFR